MVGRPCGQVKGFWQASNCRNKARCSTTESTCPALMAFKGFQDEFGWKYGLFRRSTNHAYPGSAAELLGEVEAHNERHAGKSRIVLFSLSETSPDKTLLNIGVYGTSLEECEAHLNQFSRAFQYKRATHM